MLRVPRYLECAFVCIALWFFIGNPINLLVNGAGGGQLVDVTYRQSSPILPLFSMMIFALCSSIVLFRWKLIASRLKSNLQFVLIVGLMLIIFLSHLWSGYPNISLRRSILLIGVSELAVLFSVGFSIKQQLRFLVIALCINVFLCFVFGLLLPKYGIMHAPPHTGAWRGVYTHKNKLGSQMALTTGILLVAQYSNLFKGKTVLLTRLSMCLSIFLVLAAGSTNGILTTMVMIVSFLICNILKLSYRSMVIAISFILLIAGSFSLFIQTNADAFFGLFGKGSDLTGRDEIWPALWHMISQKPLLGYGYKGFWGPVGGPADYVRDVAGWAVPNAHNGFFELFLSVGWIGGILFISSFLIAAIRSLQMVRLTKENYAIFPVLVVIFLILSNLTESNLFQLDTWIFYIWASLSPVPIVANHLEKMRNA
ncbi:MAG: O-antigen ligase family protein [Cyanobacteria bacterium P01_D01_bin.156]